MLKRKLQIRSLGVNRSSLLVWLLEKEGIALVFTKRAIRAIRSFKIANHSFPIKKRAIIHIKNQRANFQPCIEVGRMGMEILRLTYFEHFSYKENNFSLFLS